MKRPEVRAWRPLNLVVGITTSKAHIWRSKKPKMQKMNRGSRRARTGPRRAQVGRPTLFWRQFAAPFPRCYARGTLSARESRHSRKTNKEASEINHKWESRSREKAFKRNHHQDQGRPRGRRTPRPCHGAAGVEGQRRPNFVGGIHHAQWCHA
jgi:hypothetical protein